MKVSGSGDSALMRFIDKHLPRLGKLLHRLVRLVYPDKKIRVDRSMPAGAGVEIGNYSISKLPDHEVIPRVVTRQTTPPARQNSTATHQERKEPGTEVQGTEAANEALYRALEHQRDTAGNLLVSSRKEFEGLFASVPANTFSQKQLERFLTHFRKAQCYEEEAGVVFTNGMFGALVNLNRLNEDPTHNALVHDPEVAAVYQAQGIDFVVEARKQAVKGLFDTACIVDNFDPDKTWAETLQAMQMQPAGTGLYNYSNMCFMNSSLQALTTLWESSGVLNEIRAGIPVGVFINILDQLTYVPQRADYPGPKDASREAINDWLAAATNERAQDIRDRAMQMAGNPQRAIAEDNPRGMADRLRAYQKVSGAFVRLADALDGRSGGGTPVHSQKAFLQALLEYGIIMDNTGVKGVLMPRRGNESEKPLPGHKLLLARISQQDPEEFLSRISEVFGVEHRLDCTVRNVDRKQLIHNGVVKDTAVLIHNSKQPLISMSAKGQQTLQGCINAFQKGEVVNDYKWPVERLPGTGLTEREAEEAEKVRQVGFVPSGHTAPKQLVLQTKIFEYDDNGQKKYLKQEGQDILTNFQRTVEIPLYPRGDGEPEYVSYRVKAIVCHAGDSLDSGHYMTLKFRGEGEEDVVFCDDDLVASPEDYARVRSYQSSGNWRELCAQRGLCGYVYVMEKEH
ncbi:ubiquitin carboxyl-terminal hydrolase [Sansalvadorimonas verongulae]|uniref:ubiquitin carboxyl-terminal hydrolase n=1 Tax=Sansalvadorimonas verongulae TaxID=2172824 RepID=UPI0012BD5F2A|nr:ubiquitin carboxyl-terminal hydrolase family protein [Sansalvadorimonas verongulae]MTI12818.1 hypothetical protein [Sansalvadorimonas verongulae]